MGLLIVGSYIIVYVVTSIVGIVLGVQTWKMAEKHNKSLLELSHPFRNGLSYAIVLTSVSIACVFLLLADGSFHSLTYSLGLSVFAPLGLGIVMHVRASSLITSGKTNQVTDAYYTASGAYSGIWIFPIIAFVLLGVIHSISKT